MKQILIVEDDELLNKMLVYNLYDNFAIIPIFILQQKCPRNVTYRKIYDFLFEILKIFWNAKKKMHVTTHLLIAC